MGIPILDIIRLPQSSFTLICRQHIVLNVDLQLRRFYAAVGDLHILFVKYLPCERIALPTHGQRFESDTYGVFKVRRSDRQQRDPHHRGITRLRERDCNLLGKFVG